MNTFEVITVQRENWSGHQVPGSVSLPRYPSCSAQGEPSPRVREQGDVGKRWHQCHHSIHYRSSVQAPLPHQKHTLQPDYSGGLVHPPAATSHLNCSFHFPFHTILGKMLKGHSKRKGPGLTAPSAMVGTILSPALAGPTPFLPARPHLTIEGGGPGNPPFYLTLGS